MNSEKLTTKDYKNKILKIVEYEKARINRLLKFNDDDHFKKKREDIIERGKKFKDNPKLVKKCEMLEKTNKLKDSNFKTLMNLRDIIFHIEEIANNMNENTSLEYIDSTEINTLIDEYDEKYSGIIDSITLLTDELRAVLAT